MTLFLTIVFGLSATAILTAFLMERSAVAGRINGANGLILLVVLIASFLASLALAALAALTGAWSAAGWTLVLTLPWHLGLAAVTIWSLQRFATRIAAADRAREAELAARVSRPRG